MNWREIRTMFTGSLLAGLLMWSITAAVLAVAYGVFHIDISVVK